MKTSFCARELEMKRDSAAVIAELDALQNSASRFRNLVNEQRRHHSLFKIRGSFNRLCSAMDIIDDIILALRAYSEHDHTEIGLAYLEIFGVLQVLPVQQDAVIELYKIIEGQGIDLEEKYPDVREVRDVRIRVAGHPVTGKGASHFLIRHSVSKWGFELWKFDRADEHTAKQFSLVSLIRKNAVALRSAIDGLIATMEAENQMHKAKYAKSSLEEIFSTSTYLSGKLLEGSPVSLAALLTIKNMLDKFRSALEERSAHFQESDFVSHDIPKLEYALQKFERYLRGDDGQTKDDAYIVASFISSELLKLVRIAKEIDADYKVDAC